MEWVTKPVKIKDIKFTKLTDKLDFVDCELRCAKPFGVERSLTVEPDPVGVPRSRL